mmetsp:Transcript_12755/g.21526  ORF Transcript_12755/g.21526 Transcript_12755/m.21526 type:complete len:123 (+) Transcript_12755:696-1064(+)
MLCPNSLLRYIQKAFQKCSSPEERIFIECELLNICQRCKERDILFSRDWDAVTLPCLFKESKSYLNINKMIKEGDQGVIRKVQEVVEGLKNTQEPPSANGEFANQPKDEISYSFNFKKTQSS